MEHIRNCYALSIDKNTFTLYVCLPYYRHDGLHKTEFDTYAKDMICSHFPLMGIVEWLAYLHWHGEKNGIRIHPSSVTFL